RESLQGLHLLVAEDNEMNQFVTEETLKRSGCTCEIVGDGLLALEAAKSKKFDGILMDCQMPNMDGLEASVFIRRWEADRGDGRHIPIIALTAEAIQGDREKCLAAGMDGYVTKPINSEDLFAAIAATMASPEKLATSAAKKSTSTQPVAESAAPINVDALLARCMSDVDFATRTLEAFQKRAVTDVDRLRASVAAKDAATAGRLAHNLKSAAAHVAAPDLRELAFKLEEAGARKDLEFIQQELSRLDDEVRRCALYVPEALNRLATMPQTKQRSLGGKS
ncbi:MAG: response regulator, partial [Phycisphaerae bacterium]|nr:response regulator [Phycisphaerae bacterium]